MLKKFGNHCTHSKAFFALLLEPNTCKIIAFALFSLCQMYSPLAETPCHFVSTLDKLVELNEKLVGCKEFALDLEVRACPRLWPKKSPDSGERRGLIFRTFGLLRQNPREHSRVSVVCLF